MQEEGRGVVDARLTLCRKREWLLSMPDCHCAGRGNGCRRCTTDIVQCAGRGNGCRRCTTDIVQEEGMGVVDA